MRVALIHHWLLGMRGGEKVLDAIAALYPQADIFTLFLDRAAISETLRNRKITASWLSKLPWSNWMHRELCPLYPSACRSLGLRGYDVIISSDSSVVKGVKVDAGATHICYCHSPPRYLWDLESTYLSSFGLLRRAAASTVFPRLRRWDYEAAQSVSYFIANSKHVAGRVEQHYGRDAAVVYPPVRLPMLRAKGERQDYYLVVGQLVSYKRADLAIAAANELGRRLVVIGDGPEMRRLRRLAGPTVQLLGWQADEVVHRHMSECRALLFPGEEDFGMVPVEAQGAGCPVIAYAGGGALETVIDGETGVFFEEQSVQGLCSAMVDFDARSSDFSPRRMRDNAERFSSEEFSSGFSHCVNRWLGE